MAQYFPKEIDEKIIDFLKETRIEEKHRLFNDHIRPSFEKLIENLIFVYKFFKLDNVDDLKQECLAYLYEVLPKFSPDKKTKAFSYFNVVARNWFLRKVKENTKKNNIEKELYVSAESETALNNPSVVYQPEEDIVQREFFVSLFRDMKTWRSLFKKDNEIKLLEAIIFLIENSEIIPIYNNKAIRLYLREITGLNEKQVSLNLKKMKVVYDDFKRNYYNSDED